MLPRYATPTKSSRLYSYTNNNQDIISRSFRAGNFTYLKNLPRKITPLSIPARFDEHIKQNLMKTPRSVSNKRPRDYPWMADSYSRREEQSRQLRAESVKKRRSISKRDFICSGTPSREMSKERNKRSFLSVDLPYSAAKDHSDRLKWIKDSQVKHGNFKSGRVNLGPKSVSSAEEVVRIMKGKIGVDWRGSKFDVVLNREKLIEVKFALNSIEGAEAMNYYLNMLINKNEDLSKYGLKKVSGKWGVMSGGHLAYVLAPGWVALPNITVRVRRASEGKNKNLTLGSTRNTSLEVNLFK